MREAVGARAYVHDRIERNHACCASGQFESRSKNVLQIPNAAGRLLEHTLLRLVRRFPLQAEILLDRTLPAGMTYLGGGSQHTALLDANGIVVKIHRKSTFLDAHKQQVLANRLSSQHVILREFLGPLIPDQFTAVEANPLNIDLQAVVTRQKYVDSHPVRVFRPFAANIDRAALARELNQREWLALDLKLLAENGLRLYRERNLLVDISGLDNIAVRIDNAGGDRLVCLDGFPLAGSNAADVKRIVGQLQDLRRAISD